MLFAPLVILFFLDLSDNTPNNYDNFKDKIELLSWLFAGIMSLVTFSTLFLAFIYENKLIVASKNLRSMMKPYTLGTEELRNIIIDYQNSLEKDRVVQFIFYGFIIISFFSMLIWGAAVSVYTQFRFAFAIDLSISSMLVFGIYCFYLILFSILVLLTISIKLIMLNKDPLGKGYLPDINSICDTSYLLNSQSDFDEFFLKNSITLKFFKNPAKNNSFTYEAVLDLPINISNLMYVITVYNSKDKGLITFYGKTKDSIKNHEVGKRYTYNITDEFPEDIFQMMKNQDCYGIYKIIDKKYNVVGRYFLEKEESSSKNHFNLKISEKLEVDVKLRKDHQGNILKPYSSQFDFCNYQEENRKIE